MNGAVRTGRREVGYVKAATVPEIPRMTPRAWRELHDACAVWLRRRGLQAPSFREVLSRDVRRNAARAALREGRP